MTSQVNLDGLQKICQEIATYLQPQTVILLDGPMGAGKTQFVRFLVEALGGSQTASPTFSIHNGYETSQFSIEHFDLYRLEDEQDLESTGFWDFFSSDQSVVVIEWAERLDSSSLPPNWKQIQVVISFESEQLRHVRIDA